MTAVIPALRLLGLSEDEQALIAALRSDLSGHRLGLELLDAYFNGEQLVRDLGISIPPQLKGLHTVIGWPRIGVEALEQRLDLEAFRWSDGAGGAELDEIAEANNWFDEASLAHLDALTYGREYVVAGSADEEGAPPLVTFESPLDMTMQWDARGRVGLAAYRESRGDRYDGSLTSKDRVISLMTPLETVTALEVDGGWEVLSRDEHRLGVLPVLRMANRQRTADRVGKSEITPEVRSITDAACRRLMGIEVQAEFFGAPGRYILGASESAFQDAEGNAKSAWETYIGRVLALERDEDGQVPTVGQFTAHDPSGQTKIIDLYARIMATQLGLPPHMLGYTSDNPASADAIRSSEGMLVKKSERRIRRFGATHREAMRLALWVRDGKEPDPARRIDAVWRNPATPTLAAQTDAAVKMVQAGLLPADSDVALEMAGLTEDQRQRVAAERRRAAGRAAGGALLDRLAQLDGGAAAAAPAGEAGAGDGVDGL
ncbi:phage portal protein [Streptomyces uncialis]|uniref:Phage capsid scaffolding protein n=1 Tax=Streptomyces uncialis TaxID=1048205 RepID=A0A1Q4V0U4_9ACTN|nr:phage portal protein [Streptomyces uncialis]OKH91495.1 phage capsid scaffolding protein [Streptomyces uncialis]